MAEKEGSADLKWNPRPTDCLSLTTNLNEISLYISTAGQFGADKQNILFFTIV